MATMATMATTRIKHSSSSPMMMMSHEEPSAEAAALELWDMIHAVPPPPPSKEASTTPLSHRFAQAQHGRTLHHPKLPQPQDEVSSSEPEATLVKRLSKALLAAAPDGALLKDDMESPTSTLQFPSCGDLVKHAASTTSLDALYTPPPVYDMDVDYDYHVQEHVAVVVSSDEDECVVQDSTRTTRYQDEATTHSAQHTFVVCADTQLGMTSSNKEWETELEYSRQAVAYINSIEPRPSFCCVCGDLVDMEHTFYTPKGFTLEECNGIQKEQFDDFKGVWKQIHPDIALVCLCGNHDVGNRPTPSSISRFTRAFGDDYLSFWVNGTYNIVVNSNLFGNPSGALDLYREHLYWLEVRLQYASSQNAKQIFVFGHHPWFLYHEDEEPQDLQGLSPFPKEWRLEGGFPDYYFHVPRAQRQEAMRLFQKYKVQACFSGHFHQNLVSQSSWGMDMIVTAPLSMVFESSGKATPQEQDQEKNVRGVRVVRVDTSQNTFSHSFEALE